MAKLTREIVQFLRKQGYVVVTTLDKNGTLHNSCKGIVRISRDGEIYLLDLFKQRTYDNLRRDMRITVTAVDEHHFKGYSLKGSARIISSDRLLPDAIKSWEAKITSRITQRLLKNIREEKGHPRHPEARLPKPEYLILMEVKEIVDLTPAYLKEGP